MADTQLLLGLSFALFALGLVGVMVRRNALVIFSLETATLSGAVLAFLIFVVAAAEIAIAIPIVLQLSRQRSSLDVESYDRLKG